MRRAVRRCIPAGAAIAEPGDACTGVSFVQRGLIDVQQAHPSAAERLPGPILRPGDLFGSHAVEAGATYSVWLAALVEVELLELPADGLSQARQEWPGLALVIDRIWRQRAVAGFVARLARRLPGDEPALLSLVEAFQLATVAKGQVVQQGGAVVGALHVVLSGWLSAAPRRSETATGAGERRLGPGSVVCLSPLLLGIPSVHDVVAGEGVTLLSLPGPRLAERLNASPRLRIALGEMAIAGDDVQCPGSSGAAIDRSQPPEEPPGQAEDTDLAAKQPRFWQRIPMIRQRDESDCGATCLRMVHAYHGHDLGYRGARTLARVSRYGTSLLDLREAAEKLGYVATGVEVKSWESLQSVNLPAIAHVDKNHFVVLWRVGSSSVQISDPGVGKQRQSRAEFLDRFAGFLLLLRPTDALGAVPEEVAAERDRAAGEPEAFAPRRLWPFVRPHRWLLANVLLASLLIQAFGVVLPLLTQVVIDRVIGHRETGLLQVVFGGMLGIVLCEALVAFSRSYLMIHASLQIERTLLEAVYQRVLSLAHSFFSRFTTGDLVRRFGEINEIKNFFVDNAVTVLLDLLTIFTYTGILLYLQPSLAGVYLGVLALSTAIMWVLVRPVRGHTLAFMQKFARVNTHVIDSFKGIDPIKAMALERPFARWFGGLLLPALRHGRSAAQWSVGATLAVQLLDGANSAILLWRGANLILANQLTLGQLVAFLMLARQLTGPFLRLLQQWGEFQRTLVSLHRVGDLLQETPELVRQERQGAGLELRPIRGQVEFDNVTFRYESDPKDSSKNVIEALTLRIAPGEVVGIVGRSGCGKSTIARLLLRFHEPTGGRILIDDIHLRDLDARTLRSQIGLVTQEAFLYSATIRENIACGRPEVGEAELIRAAQAAGAYEFISELPYGFETMIGEQGLQLSGGQAQRIVIARALCTDPRILVFDEATAALDPIIEQEIHEGLREVIRGRTTIIIAHRLHTLRRADRIVVLDRGRLVEQGNHDQLMAQQGLYWRMFTASPDWHGREQSASSDRFEANG
jgi:ATP-binding cassette subfamily B protein